MNENNPTPVDDLVASRKVVRIDVTATCGTARVGISQYVTVGAILNVYDKLGLVRSALDPATAMIVELAQKEGKR